MKFHKLILTFLLSTLAVFSFAQDVTLTNLFDLYQANEPGRLQILNEMGFNFHSKGTLPNNPKIEYTKYKAKKLGKGGMWYESILIYKGRKQITFITENTTLNDNLKKDLTGKYRFIENIDREKNTSNVGVLYTRDSCKIELLSKPGEDEQTDHYINILKFDSEDKVFTTTLLANARFHALLIGVDKYANGDLDLEWPVESVKRLKDVLIEKYGFKESNIHQLIASPTRDQILNELDALRSLEPDDNLFIFFSGHGSFDSKAGEGYWLPSDGNINTRSTSISNHDLITRLKGLSCGHVAVISDACYGGSLFRFKPMERTSEKSISQQYQIRSRHAITSAGLKKSPDQTIFIEKLISILTKNGNDYLSIGEIYRNISTKLEELHASDPGIPTPEFGNIRGTDDQGGEFIFKLKE